MSFRARLLGAIVLILVVALGASFAAVAFVIDRTEGAQLDGALLDAARREALAVSPSGALDDAIEREASPSADDVAPRLHYAAVYDSDGALRGASAALGRGAPVLSRVRHPAGHPFDAALSGEPMRCVFTAVPSRPGALLLLAAPRADLDADARLLARVAGAAFVLALLWAVAVVHWTVGRMTRDLDRIARTATRVASGDLAARSGVGTKGRDEIARLAGDVDAMIARLEALVTAQQRFVADAAHELRSPLTALYGELTLALHASPDAEGYRRAIEHGVDATEQLMRLAEDLLALARLRAGRARDATVVELSDVVAAAVRSLRDEARDRGVGLDVSGDRPSIEGRAGDLERLVRNVLENALRHAPRGSSVRVATSSRADRAEIAITDEGPGVPPDARERIFEPFYRGPRERAADEPGAGLGLAIAREVARAHRGDVAVEPARDGARGACFVVSLPRTAVGRDAPG